MSLLYKKSQLRYYLLLRVQILLLLWEKTDLYHEIIRIQIQQLLSVISSALNVIEKKKNAYVRTNSKSFRLSLNVFIEFIFSLSCRENHELSNGILFFVIWIIESIENIEKLRATDAARMNENSAFHVR